MGRYIEYDDIANRYPELDTLGGSDEINSAFIVYAEAYVDGLLQPRFTPPFSVNNATVKDLTIDCVYWRAGRHKLDDAVEVKSSFFVTIDMLKAGKMSMITTSGSVIENKTKAGGYYSSTQSYHSSFGIDDPLYWSVDSSHIDDQQDSRL